jgi:hypothetical protein
LMEAAISHPIVDFGSWRSSQIHILESGLTQFGKLFSQSIENV